MLPSRAGLMEPVDPTPFGDRAARPSTGRRVRQVACGVGLVVFPGSASAASPPTGATSLQIDYRAPAKCPGASTFKERVAARTAPAPDAGGVTATTLTVRVTEDARSPTIHGELVAHYADGTTATRTVDGESCSSVADALALMCAIALDRGEHPLPVAPASDPVRPAPPASSRGEHPSALDVQPGLHVSVGAGGGATFAIAPTAAPSGGAFVEIARRGDTVGTPSLRVGFDYAVSGVVPVAGGALDSSRAAGIVEGCPLLLRVSALRIAPCLGAEAGELSVSGLDVTPANSPTRPWFAVSAVGRVRYVPFDRVFFELSGGLTAPLVRDRFYFGPSGDTAFRPPAYTGLVGGAVGMMVR